MYEIIEESRPPLKKMPIGTSLIILSLTELSNAADNFSVQ